MNFFIRVWIWIYKYSIFTAIVILLKIGMLFYLNLTFMNTLQTWAYNFDKMCLYELVNEQKGYISSVIWFLKHSVFVRAYVAAVNHHDQSNFGRKGLVWLTLLYHCAFLKNSGQVLKQRRNLRQELIQRPWRDVSHWLVPHVLLNLVLIKPKTTIPMMAQPTMSWTLPHESHIENVLRLDLRKTFSQFEFPPSVKTSFSQSDMQLTSPQR